MFGHELQMVLSALHENKTNLHNCGIVPAPFLRYHLGARKKGRVDLQTCCCILHMMFAQCRQMGLCTEIKQRYYHVRTCVGVFMNISQIHPRFFTMRHRLDGGPQPGLKPRESLSAAVVDWWAGATPAMALTRSSWEHISERLDPAFDVVLPRRSTFSSFCEKAKIMHVLDLS